MLPATILIVDSTEDCAIKAAQLLIPEGHGVLMAKNEAKGFELLKRCQPDLVLVDSSCVANPLEWLEQAGKLHLSSQIIAICDNPDFATAMHWVACGIFTVLEKSLQNDSFLNAINLALEAGGSLQELVSINHNATNTSLSPAYDKLESHLINFQEGLLERVEIFDLVRYASQALKKITGAQELDIYLSGFFNKPRYFRGGSPLPQEGDSMSLPPLDEKLQRHQFELIMANRHLGELIFYFEGESLPALVKRSFLNKIVKSISAALNVSLKYQRAVNLASRDSLTNLYNRRIFSESLKREYSEAKRYDLPLSLLILDLDHFKAVNDNFGHQTGDEVLKGIARVIEKVCRNTDIPARIGGEEFAIILPHTTKEQAFYFAERLKKALAADANNPAISLVRQTISQGIASLEHFLVNSYEDLVYWADQALYLAKREGRDTIRMAADVPLKPMIEERQYAFQ